ncbi:YjcZ family sporulation protein [Paenibacillus sp. D51F]
MSEFEHRNLFSNTGAILVLFILLVIIVSAFCHY